MTSLWERLRALDPEPDALGTPDAVKRWARVRRARISRASEGCPHGTSPFSPRPDLPPPLLLQWLVAASTFAKARDEIDAKGSSPREPSRGGRRRGRGIVRGRARRPVRGSRRCRAAPWRRRACPAARNPHAFVQFTAPGQAPRPTQPRGSCKHSAALLLWREVAPGASDRTRPAEKASRDRRRPTRAGTTTPPLLVTPPRRLSRVRRR